MTWCSSVAVMNRRCLRHATHSAVRNTPDFHDTAAQAKVHHWEVVKCTAKQTEFEETGIEI